MSNVLVTGGAGFIGSNFVRHALHGAPRLAHHHARQADLRRPAGEPQGVLDHPRHTFVSGDVADPGGRRRRWSQDADIVVHFAAETHVDRSMMNAGEFITTDVYGTFVLLEAARAGATAPAVRPDLDRRGLRQRARGLEPRDRRAAAAESLLGEQGRRRSARLQLLGDLRRAGGHHPGVEQLRAEPVSREGHPAVHHQRHRRHPGAALRRRAERARLAARARPLPRASIC